MSGEALAVAPAFIVACASATFFLLKRCDGKGRPFGPSSRRWAVLVIVLTSVLSAVGAIVVGALGRYVPAVIMSLTIGVAAPGGLCLGRIREGIPERRSTYGAALTLWLGWLLSRMNEGMAEDKLQWCARYIDASWHPDELIMAAHHYYKYLEERLSDEDRKSYRIRALLQDVETRLDLVVLIDSDAPRSRVTTAIKTSRVGKEARYQRYLNDLARLGNRFEFDARRYLERLVAAAYLTNHYRLERYVPSAPRLSPEPAEPSGSPRWHP